MVLECGLYIPRTRDKVKETDILNIHKLQTIMVLALLNLYSLLTVSKCVLIFQSF